MVEIGAPKDIQKLYNFVDDVSDSELFETWKPKIRAYLADLDKEAIEEYRVPSTEVPKDLDEKSFDTVEFLNETKHLSEEEKRITDSSVVDIEKEIASKKLSSVAVLKAFAHRAVILNQFTNFATQFFIREALTKAQELDDYISKTGKTVGPLHGIPISVKEQIGMAGKVTHGGWVAWLDFIPKEDATTVKVLKDLGAVMYVRTNEPQTLMHLDSNNNITGRTRNPFNSILSAGGSSGGEGACVGGRGSAIGVGSDIGGSIRAPAAFCGAWGFRPTTRRISTAGGVSSGKGQETIVAVEGPLAHSAEDVDYFMKSYINSGKPWEEDPWCIPLPWREVAKPKASDITVAIIYDNGLVAPHPPIARGLNAVAEKLKAAGVNVIKFEPLEAEEAYDVCCQIYTCDGNLAQKAMLKPSGEPLLPLTKWAFSMGNGDKALSIIDNRNLTARRDNLRKVYNDYFVKNKVDFIISPTYVGVAPCTVDDGIAGPFFWGYTSLWNILDLPTLVAPTGLSQDPKIDTPNKDYKPRSYVDKIEQNKYIPELFEKAPICLQLTGRRYFDEEVVAFGELFEDVMNA
ncbi:DEKNAAC103813 [Brettanomyces naardenensis]|uniref:amidase n=1 Tax=Brettanomyces naardenensis TaxID=13370 RepID=A0A448YP85_BRENA|nr:DEKNAAC103813 [Brettanomyces naardenensis]